MVLCERRPVAFHRLAGYQYRSFYRSVHTIMSWLPRIPFNTVSKSGYRGLPVITFSSVNDVNAGYSSGTFGASSVSLYAPVSIQLTPIAGTPARATVDLTGALNANALLQQWDYNKNTVIGFLVRVDNPAAYDTGNTLTFYATNTANRLLANWFSSGFLKIDSDRGGWFFLTLNADRNSFVETNGVIQQGLQPDGYATNNLVNSAANLINSVRFDVTVNALNNTATQSIYVDSIWINPATTPTLLLMFDDGYSSQYSEAALYMGSKGLKGSIGVVSSLVGTNGYMNAAILQTLYNSGWDLINHSASHWNAGLKSVNSITGGAGAIINAGAQSLTGGTIGTNPFDAPRHIVITSAAAEQGRPFTIIGLDEYGNAQTDVVYAKNSDSAVSETVWTRITSITNSSATATIGNIQIGTSYSYAELYNDYLTCKNYLALNGWTRGSNLAIVPNGVTTGLLVRAFGALGIYSARGVSNRVNFAYPNLPGYNPLNLPGFGGGNAPNTAVTMTTSADIYNTAGTGAFSLMSFNAVSLATWQKYVMWKLVINAGAVTFDISDLDGNYIGTGSSGTAFTRFGVTFTFTAGTSPAGSVFYINIGSNMTTLLKETIRKKAVCVAYLHNILAANAGQGSLDIYRSDFRTFIDEVAADVAKGNVICPTYSDFYASTTTS